MTMTRIALAPIALMLVVVFTAAACEQNAIEDNRRQVEKQQQMIEETQKELAAIQTQQQQTYGPPPALKPSSGNCDKKVMATATRRGGDAFANGNLQKALGYYQDALTACPDSAKSDMNLGRTYEAMGNRDAAIRYYRAAANSGGSDPDSVQEGRVALSRLGISN
jgi:tetratricopeptide (TPR) repeat protein